MRLKSQQKRLLGEQLRPFSFPKEAISWIMDEEERVPDRFDPSSTTSGIGQQGPQALRRGVSVGQALKP